MSATPLPPSGDVPAPKTCDASGMIDIHRMFRRGFGEGPALVRLVADGDTGHAAAVATQLETLSLGLHAHHEGEDARLWDALDERAPSCAVHVERMKAQHAALLEHLRALDGSLPAWRTSAGRADAEPVLAALQGVNAAIAVHLPDEEANIVPVMEHTITEAEVQWFSDHGRRSIPKGQTWQQLGEILASQPDGGDEWLHTHMPPPARLAWRWIGRRRYAQHRARLEGR
ncbi:MULTISPECIES: hemerythrin domain-containing protein [unclassified Microbacterium]|uniref:hemerythrin domain-containing protein n=1 Tax=unclassified Microbacterium TaxID=2609290 RepID=UPI00214CFA76|nr:MULTISPECIES: hemerythrin domain-containing protein [unclassified Microbacterium]MCR2808788.1 hemerythrin domain-containing protein [Microbacterium sp. zg.B185]WIM18788.1 hemerythrin domain-containing protein [Microbacterium sp. zg-B185]